ncbi:MAG: NUDIX hydrolase [Pseudomonadota bacterium]
MRQIGEPRKPGQRYTRRPGAYAIIARGSQLLLTEQRASQLELQLPGGGIDPGETPVQALHREVYEETGYRIRHLQRLGTYQRFTYMPEYSMWAHKICHIYLAAPALRKCDPPEPGHRVIWMPAQKALFELTARGDRLMLSRALGYRKPPASSRPLRHVGFRGERWSFD